ncbi:ABC transporter substrate-binding protein [Aquipuribacter sp. SD81]|uniref:ABC transporter substrate-binding protein n=1 Tax=Aquipuribacter sp. SD81 TaxID=3127703 RepID=UPI0030199C2C
MTVSRRTFVRGLGYGATIGAVGAGLAACSSDTPAPAGSAGGSAAAGGSGELTLTTWGSDAEIAAFQTIADRFAEAEGVTVTIENLPYDQIRTVVDRRLQAGQAPDLFRVSYTDVGGYASRGVLADLSGTLDASYGEEFLPALWAAVQSDGVPVGVPHHTDTSALAFNVEHLEAAGVTSVPQSLEEAWTWEELVEVLTMLRESDIPGAPFAFNYQAFGAFRWFNTLYQAGGQVLDGDTAALGSPEARKALEWTKGLYTDGLHEPSVLVRRPTYPDEIFPTGQISMIQTGDFLVPSLEAAIDGRFEWGVTYLPQDVAAAADLGGNAVVVTEQSRDPQAAAAFARFLGEAEQMQYFCEQTTVLPVRNDLAEAELAFGVRPDLLPVFQQQATTFPEDLVLTTVSPAFPGINQALVDNLDQYLGSEDSSTDEVVEVLNADIEAAVAAQA